MIKIRIIFLVIFFSCVFTVYSQVGIGVEAPTAMLDVEGEVKVRTVNKSTNVQDIAIVIDDKGYVKKKKIETLGIFKGYLSQNLEGSNTGVKKITNFKILHNPNSDFNNSSSLFTAPIDGTYKFIITTTLKNKVNNISQNYIGLGVLDGSTGDWLSRFDVAKEFTKDKVTGLAITFIGAVNLKKNQTCYFGLYGNADILYYPTGPSGSGLGTYFEITLL